MGGKKLSKSASGYSKTKKKEKKVAWTNKPFGWGGGKTLVKNQPLKKHFFMKESKTLIRYTDYFNSIGSCHHDITRF